MTDKQLVKSAGEHWVSSVLSRLGWAVALTRDGLAGTDILGVRTVTGQMIEVQVKASSPTKNPRFILGAKGCVPALTDREWHVFVALPAEPWDRARAFIVPRDHVAAATWISHMEWLTNPTAPPGTRNTPIGNARVDWRISARYEHRWDLLERLARDAPVMLPPRYREWAQEERVGLRPDHPWLGRLPNWDQEEISPDWQTWLLAAVT